MAITIHHQTTKPLNDEELREKSFSNVSFSRLYNNIMIMNMNKILVTCQGSKCTYEPVRFT